MAYIKRDYKDKIERMADRKDTSINKANSLNNALLFWATCANNKLDRDEELQKVWELYKIIGELKNAHFSETIEEIVKHALRVVPFEDAEQQTIPEEQGYLAEN